MKEKFSPFLNEYSTLIYEGYKIRPNPSYIYGFENLVTAFSKNETNKESIKYFLKEIVVYTFSNYFTNLEKLEENPQLTEDFFGLLFRIMKINPLFVLELDIFESLMLAVFKSIGISHPKSSKYIIQFINKVLKYQKHELFKNLDSIQLAPLNNVNNF